MNHNGSLVYVIPASADQLQKRLDSLTSCSGKEKDDDGVEEYEGNKLDLYKSDVVYNVSGVKNSGNLSALLIIVILHLPNI